MQFRGIFSAVAMPIDADHQVDEWRLRSLVESTIGGGVHGLVTCGSTGEFAHISAEERRKILEVVLDQNQGRVPVVAHTGAMTTSEAIELSKHAERIGAAGVMAVAPYYDHLSIAETMSYFRDIADSISIPVIIYNLPLATGVNLAPEDIADIAAAAGNIQYVKDTSGDYNQITRLIHDYSDVISTFVGWDTMLLASFVEGAAGSIIGATNFLAPQLVTVYTAVQAGDLASAKRQWDEIYPVMRFLVSGGYVGGIKGAFDILEAPIGPPLAPVADLSPERREEFQKILVALEIKS